MTYPSDELIRKLRGGKAELRRTRRNSTLEERLHDLVRAQQMYVEIVASRRAPKPLERPWDILSDIRDAVVIKDGLIERRAMPTAFSASSSDWVRPPRRWML